MSRGPFVVFLLAALLLGAAGGFAVGVRRVPEPEPCPPPKSSELEVLCATSADAAHPEQLREAQAQVDTLVTALKSKEDELSEALAKVETSADARDAMVAKARSLEKDVFALRGQLGQAKDERDRLLEELRTTVEKLDFQVQATDAARAEVVVWQGRSTSEQWRGFVAESKNQVCVRGTAKRVEGCQEAVEGVFSPDLRTRYVACLEAGSAKPSLGRLEKGQSLPAFAVSFPEDRRFPDKGWYVLLCDPTLPEAGSGSQPAP